VPMLPIYRTRHIRDANRCLIGRFGGRRCNITFTEKVDRFRYLIFSQTKTRVTLFYNYQNTLFGRKVRERHVHTYAYISTTDVYLNTITI